MEKHLRLLAELTPAWLTVHQIRKDMYLKLNKTLDLNIVLDKLNQKMKEEERIWGNSNETAEKIPCAIFYYGVSLDFNIEMTWLLFNLFSQFCKTFKSGCYYVFNCCVCCDFLHFNTIIVHKCRHVKVCIKAVQPTFGCFD